MLQKTEMSEVSTNAEIRVTSFFTSRNREMFRGLKKGQVIPKRDPFHQFSTQDVPNDVLYLSPATINTLSWPSIYLFENDVVVAIKSNYYEISGVRGSKRFIERRSQINAELVHFWAEKPTNKFHFVSVERFLECKSQISLHINLTKFNPQKNIIEAVDFQIASNQQQRNSSVNQFWDFCSFQVVEQCKKGILVVRSYSAEQNNNHYKIILLDLVDRRKANAVRLPNERIKARVLTVFDLDCEGSIGCSKQRFLKTIKSEFGDIVLVVTSVQVYEIEVEQMGQGFKINLKPYKVSKAISNSKSHYFKQDKPGESKMIVDNNFDEEIFDVRFMSNGLKLMVLTSNAEIIVIQSHNYLFSQSILEVFNNSKYLLDQFVFQKVYPVNGAVAVQFHSKSEGSIIQSEGEGEHKAQRLTKGVIILKMQNNSFSLGKVINFHLEAKDLLFILVRECEGSDEMMIQYIQKRESNVLNVMKCHILMMELNALNKFTQFQYNYSRVINQPSIQQSLSHFHPIQAQKKYHMVDMPLTGRVFFMINEKQLTCYKIFNDLDSEKINRQISKLFTHSFFQKPIKITVSPCTQHIAIIFREFVKFFYFTYAQIKHYFTLKVKNAIDIKFVGRGEKCLLVDSEGIVYLLDSYGFKEERVLDIHGEASEAEMIDERNMLVRSSRNVLSLYRKMVDEQSNRGSFEKVYEIRMDEGDLYAANKRNIVVVKKGQIIEVYSHSPLVIPKELPQTERECYFGLQALHPHLVNRSRCASFTEGEFVSRVLLSEQLGFLLLATSKGNVKQYMWPLQSPTNPNPPAVASQQVCSTRILNMFLDAKLVNLYVVSENGVVLQLGVSQYINGQLMPYVYVFSEKTREEEMQKRQFTDRAYFIDHFTPTEAYLTQASQQNIEELQFLIDKLKDDIEEMVKSMGGRARQEEGVLKAGTRQVEKELRAELKGEEERYAVGLQGVRGLIEQQERQFQLERSKEVEGYQKSLLGLYKESDRLKNVLASQDAKLSEERNCFRRDFEERLSVLNRQKEEEVRRLQKEYKEIEQKRRLGLRQNQIFERQEEAEMEIYKAKIHGQEQEELQQAEEEKERLLGENTKKEKEISNLKNRGIYFQNLILQTKVQIAELVHDQEEYDSKKKYLGQELRDKEDIIEKIEHELVVYLKNTEDMKTIKNNHEFQLEEYENEVHPISDNFQQIESNVKQMNLEIMKEYSLKVEKTELAERNLQLIESLKERKRQATVKKLSVENRFTRLAERLTYLATHPFDVELRVELKGLLEEGEGRGEEGLRVDEQRERQRREGEKLIRYKNMIRKEIEEEEKREEHIVKNQHEFYKYHNENTTLVREFNELKKLQKHLREELNKLEERVGVVKTSLFATPVRRVPSVNLRRVVEKKLTPFQRYEEEQQMVVERKHQDTSDTKLTRNSQSLSFLKGLMKELNHTESKYEKVEVMRERVRTFVNPELKSKTEEIRKLLFGRTRGTSEMLKLK